MLESEDPLRQKTRYEWETPFGPKKVTGSGGDERYFEWDKRGNLVSHTDCSGNVSRHAYDENGHPAGEMDAEGRKWSADYSAWGERQYALPLDPEEAAPSGTDCALRFQGQYFDAETGLHYNTLRYYDPGCGRFISPDPINIQGGLNLYQYAPNAANWIDPWGWCPTKKGAIKAVGLPTKGRIRYVPPKDWKPTTPLPKKRWWLSRSIW
ncbi:MAG: hypothetical protein LBF51_05640 [Zoogloeaceae bacterium]|nr:hypothetical protein [Zoogloeaceae bacterium]